jgi:hypothetical protein
VVTSPQRLKPDSLQAVTYGLKAVPFKKLSAASLERAIGVEGFVGELLQHVRAVSQ